MMLYLEHVCAKIVNTFLLLNATLNVKSYMIQVMIHAMARRDNNPKSIYL